MKKPEETTRKNSQIKNIANFDKIEFVGLSMFGVSKNRKTTTLSYENVFLLEKHCSQPHFVKRKETKLFSKKTNCKNQTVNYSTHCSTTNYTSSNNGSPIKDSKIIEITQPVSPKQDQEPKKERRMLSLKELLH